MAIITSIPPELSDMEDFLHDFFQGMVYKLEVNSHKQPPEGTDEGLQQCLNLIRDETVEFELQILQDKTDQNALEETFDIANSAFIAYLALSKNES